MPISGTTRPRQSSLELMAQAFAGGDLDQRHEPAEAEHVQIFLGPVEPHIEALAALLAGLVGGEVVEVVGGGHRDVSLSKWSSGLRASPYAGAGAPARKGRETGISRRPRRFR